MKKIFLIALLGVSISAFSQKLDKYEDALPRILTLPASGALAQLKLYLAEEPGNPSIYLQMAVIYEKRYRNSDPIKDYAYKVGNAEEALKAYIRTEQFITEKDVRKNEENYFNFGRLDEKGRVEVEFDTVQNKIAASKIELKNYIDNMPAIYDNFTKSFSSYDQAHKHYTEILGKYPTFKDLYLLYDQDVDKQFEQIKSEYLECLQYWKAYKETSANFDFGYDQNLSIKPIRVYRLEGLESKINFLVDDITVWDYAQWVDTTRSIISSEIEKLRRDLLSEHLRLDKRLEEAVPDFVRDEFEPLKVSKEVLFQLRKYDLNSVVEPIFVFKEKKHDLIYQEMLSKQLDTSKTVDVDRKLYLYGQMVNRIREADSVLSDIRRRNTPMSMEKYQDFVKTYYSGQSGITSYVTGQRQDNKEDVTKYISTIQNNLYTMLATDSIVETVNYRRMKIPIGRMLTVSNASLTQAPVTTHRIENFDGSLFIGGIMRNEKEQKTQAYVCGITPDTKIGWYNEYLLQIDSSAGFDSHTRVGAMTSIPGGLAVILNGLDTNGVRINHLLMLDEKGIVTHSRRLVLNQFPRNITYSERTNSLFVTYKGEDYLDDILQESEMIMASYNILGDLLWQSRITYKGDVVDVVSVDQAYLVIGNYNEIKGMDGRIKRAGRNNTDTRLFTLKIDQSGEIVDLKSIEHSISFYASKAYKVSDDCINLFGSVGNYTKRVQLDTEPGSAVHIILNKEMDVLANSLN